MSSLRAALITVVALVLVASGTHAAEARATWAVTIAVDRTTLDLGGSVTVSGRVSPHSKGTSVRIQRKYAGGSWATVATVRVTSASTYSRHVKPTRAGVTQYRVLKSASSTRSAGASATKNVTAFRWRYLADMPFLTSTLSQVVDSTKVSGFTYRRVLTQASGAGRTWTLAQKCDQFYALLGAIDDPDHRGEVNGQVHTIDREGLLTTVVSTNTTSADDPILLRRRLSRIATIELHSYGNPGIAAWPLAKVHCAS